MALVLRIEVDDKKAAASIKRFAKRAGADVKSLQTTTNKSAAGMSAAFGGVGKQADRLRVKTSGLSATIGALRNNFLLVGFASAGIVKGMQILISASSDLTESVNAVNVVFKEGSDTITDFGEKAAVSVGLANSEFNQLAAVTGALLRDVGKPLDEVADLTIELTKRAADLASVFNTEVSDAMNAINAAIRGETEAIRRYGGDVTDASLQQFLLAQGIFRTVSAMTQQEKRLLRIKVLMAQTDDVQGDFKNTQGQLANATRTLWSRTKNLAAALGDELVPAATNAVLGMGKLVTVMDRFFELRDKLEKLRTSIPFAGIIEDAVTKMRIAIQKMGDESPEEIKKLAAAFKSGVPLAQLFFLSIDEGFDRLREKKIELPEFLSGKGDVPLRGLRTELGFIKKQTEDLATTEVVTLLTAFENVKIEAFNTRSEILKSQGIFVDIDLVMLRQLESMEKTAELWQTKMNPEAAAYLEKLRETPDVIDDVKEGMSDAARLGQTFANTLGQAALNSRSIESTMRSIASTILSFALNRLFSSPIPGFAHGTSFAPGGLAVVGEQGPELVNLPRGSQVIPNNRTTNNHNVSFGDINITNTGGKLDAEDVSRAFNEAVDRGLPIRGM